MKTTEQKTQNISINQAKQSARSFYLAYKRCMTEVPMEDGTVEMLIIPAIVCGVLSIEILWKSLLLKTGHSLKIHKISQLFEELDENIKAKTINKSGMDSESFSKALLSLDNVFIEWRYIYEYDYRSIDINFLKKLIDISQGLMNI